MLDPKIKAAIHARHGGLDKADDYQLQQVYDAMTPQARQDLLKPSPQSKQGKEAKDDSPGSDV